jgi:hypothetical protein
VIGKCPNSDLAEILNDIFLSPKIVLHKLSKITDESSKLFLYSKLKNDIILEPYLLQLSNFKKIDNS